MCPPGYNHSKMVTPAHGTQNVRLHVTFMSHVYMLNVFMFHVCKYVRCIHVRCIS